MKIMRTTRLTDLVGRTFNQKALSGAIVRRFRVEAIRHGRVAAHDLINGVARNMTVPFLVDGWRHGTLEMEPKA